VLIAASRCYRVRAACGVNPRRDQVLFPGFFVDANKQTLAYVYGHADTRDAQVAKALTLDEARRIASNIAELPSLLIKGG
jgi:hypothetical protein